MDEGAEGLDSAELSKLASLMQLRNGGHTSQELGARGGTQDKACDELSTRVIRKRGRRHQQPLWIAKPCRMRSDI